MASSLTLAAAMWEKMRHLKMQWSYQLMVQSRRRKLDLFWKLMAPRPGQCVLNLGATPPHVGRALLGSQSPEIVEQPEQDPRWKTLRVIGTNILPDNVREYGARYPGNACLVSDGCSVPFADKSMDIVFSNAVIEHLLPEQQSRMAREIMRVGRSWFVTTPNFWYPIELHHKLPLIHFLPRGWQQCIARRLSGWPADEPIHLLSARRMRELFPGSQILKLRVTFWPESLIAFYREPAADCARSLARN